MCDGGSKECHCPHREADRVDGLIGECLDDAGSEIGVRLRVVRFWGLAMPEQIDADHPATGVSKQFGEPGLLPGGGE